MCNKKFFCTMNKSLTRFETNKTDAKSIVDAINEALCKGLEEITWDIRAIVEEIIQIIQEDHLSLFKPCFTKILR